MIAVDLNNDVIIPSGVAIFGALVAGISAVLKSWFENKDARSRGDRKLDLAKRRTEFAKDWIEISKELEDADVASADPEGLTPASKAKLIGRAREELREAARETEIAFYDATTDTSTGLLQLRRLLMLVRRRNLASYVVSGLFLFSSVFAWLLVCIPAPGDDGFSIPAAIFVSIVATFVLRVLAGLMVSGLEHYAIKKKQRIKNVAVKDNVVTITTFAAHGFAPDNEVTIDASDDRFDGVFEVIGVPNKEALADATKFTFELRAPDAESLPGVTGWVCGEPVKNQLKRLMLIPTGGGLAWAATALFLLPLLVFSIVAVRESKNSFDSVRYPRCIGQPYDGAYFGEYDFFANPVDAATFLRDAPVWSANKLQFDLESDPVGSPSADSGSGYLGKSDESAAAATLVDSNGDRYTLDQNGALRYEHNRTQLYRKVGVSQLKAIGDPCDPQQLTVSAYRQVYEAGPPPVDGKGNEAWIDDENKIWLWSEQGWTTKTDVEDSYYDDDLSYTVFLYYDDSKGYGTGGEFVLLLGDTGDGTTKKISAYFGRDGRLIPVCNSVEYPEIQPCLERGDAYLDSGLDAAVTRAFWTGLVILTVAIGWRLLFWIVAKLLGREAHEDRKPEHDPEPAASASVVA